MNGIGYLAALLGGLLALLSPCSALLLPAFFAYSIDSTSRLLARTGIFYAGLASTLVPLGAAGSYAGRFFHGHREGLVLFGGWLIIALGLAQILGLGFSSRRISELSGRIRPVTALSVYALGAVYGLAGFCAGPILGSVLTVAAVSGSPVYGGLLLAVYALGMAVPLFLLALLWERFDLGRRRWLRGRALRLGRSGCTRPRCCPACSSSPWAPCSWPSTGRAPCPGCWTWTIRTRWRSGCVPSRTRCRTGRCWAWSPRVPWRSGWCAGAGRSGRVNAKAPSDGRGLPLWLGPGSNRRPIAFQAIARTN